MFERLKSDIRCVLERDPAARSGFEVFLCYPGFHAVRNHRTAHFLHTHGMKMLARAILSFPVSSRVLRFTPAQSSAGSCLSTMVWAWLSVKQRS